MVAHWVPAAKALALVTEHQAQYPAMVALCKRAHQGLVRARARCLKLGDKIGENVLVPEKFWWAEGEEALEQDWKTGDFSTWIDRTFHWQAFDVSFELAGLLDMLPVERRPLAARALSVAGNPSWITAQAAQQFAYEKAGAVATKAGRVLIDQCCLGFVVARAVLMQRADGGRPDDWSIEEREWDVPQWFWANFTATESSSQDWGRGVFAGKGRGPNGLCWTTLTGVHFLNESIVALAPPKEIPALLPAKAPGKGGRPPAEFWDDMWAAVATALYDGTLTAKTQADVERAMAEWIEANGYSAADSTVRARARRLWDRLSAPD